MSRVLPDSQRAKARRVSGVAFAILIHLSLISLILGRAAESNPRGPGSGRQGSTLSVFSLSPPSNSPNAQANEDIRSPVEPTDPGKAKSRVETTKISPPLETEWKLVHMSAEPVREGGSASSTSRANQSTSSATGQFQHSSGAGGPGYDPYAGASPMLRRLPNISIIEASSARSLNSERTRQLQTDLQANNALATGAIVISVTVQADGTISQAKEAGKPAAGTDLEKIFRSLVGAQLFDAVRLSRGARTDTIKISISL